MMEIQEFIGRSDNRSKLRLLLIPAFLLGIAGYWLYMIFRANPQLLEFTNITKSIIVAMPFFIGIFTFEHIKRIVFRKANSEFYVKYQISEKYVDVRFLDLSIAIKISEIEKIRDPELTGQFMHFVLKTGKEYSTPVPDNKLELYTLLKQRVA